MPLGKAKTKATAKRGTCWKGYVALGMKNKGGKQVPNCVRK